MCVCIPATSHTPPTPRSLSTLPRSHHAPRTLPPPALYTPDDRHTPPTPLAASTHFRVVITRAVDRHRARQRARPEGGGYLRGPQLGGGCRGGEEEEDAAAAAAEEEEEEEEEAHALYRIDFAYLSGRTGDVVLAEACCKVVVVWVLPVVAVACLLAALLRCISSPHMYVCVCMCMYVCMCVCVYILYIYMHTCVCVYIYMYMYIYMYTCIYITIYI